MEINNTWRLAGNDALFDPNFGRYSETIKFMRQKLEQ